jgi:beta-glucanase (GH16 family)
VCASRRIWFSIISAVCLLGAAAGAAWAQTHASGASVSWAKVWSASFAGPAGRGINTSYWKYDTGTGIFGTGEVETVTDSPANVHIDGHGGLDITAFYQGGSWVSGRIETRRSNFGAPAGGEMKVTASIKQPDPAVGLGYWPAFWMLGAGSWPRHGEIDVLEDVDGLSAHSGTLHCGNLSERNSDGSLGPCHEPRGLTSGLLPCHGCETGYHVYSVVVDRRNPADEQIRWYLDGRDYFSVSESQVGAATWDQAVNHGFSIILDLAIGGEYPDWACGCTALTGQTSSWGTLHVRDVAVYYSWPGPGRKQGAGVGHS